MEKTTFRNDFAELEESIKLAIEHLRQLETNGVVDITTNCGKPRVYFTTDSFLKNFKDYKETFRNGLYVGVEKECKYFIAASSFRDTSRDEKVEALISKIDDLMEKETDPKRKEGLFEAYAELLKVR